MANKSLNPVIQNYHHHERICCPLIMSVSKDEREFYGLHNQNKQ
jgi:hypothetical protein